jgi:hypothetical protein
MRGWLSQKEVLLPTELPNAIAPVIFVGSSRRDLKAFPEDVQDEVGYAVFVA